MATRELRHMPNAADVVRILSTKHQLSDFSRVGSNFEELVSELHQLISEHTSSTIKRLNGSGSPIFNTDDPIFRDAVGMVAEDVANALLRHRVGDAFELLESSALDVLSQLAHLKLDFENL